MTKLCQRELCTGCGACFNACPRDSIKMILSSREGFLYPLLNNSTCADCGLCSKVCPILTSPSKYDEPDVYAAWNMDDSIRQSSSSGGMFLTLAQKIIEQGGVVYGVVISKDGTVYHNRTDSVAGLKPMQGSKYVQSDTRYSFKEALNDLKHGLPVMYTGTPCQIAGFRGLLGKRRFDNLLLVDIVCHGVPSNALFKDYLKKLDAEWADIPDKSSFIFRELDAWGYAPSVKLTDGKRHRIPSEKDAYMKNFLASYTFRESCYNCQFANIPRISDLTIADFWGIGAEKPFSENTKKGCSLVLVNNEKGRCAIRGIENEIFLEKRTLEEAKAVNHQLYRPSIRPKLRNNMYSYCFSHSISDVYKHFYNTPYHKLRHFVGRILRFLKIKK